VELRAGSGCRLHGYGGIHTLERLPVPVEDEIIALGPARLEWDIETFEGYASVCSLGESLVSPGSWVLSSETVAVTTLAGGWTDTLTASGVITGYGPGESPDACADPIFATTKEDGVDYGDGVSSSYSEDTLLFTDLIPVAIGAVAPLASSNSAHEWTPEFWRAVSEGVPPWPFSVLLGFVDGGVDSSGAIARNVRFRLRNRGSVSLRVDCGFYGSGLSGGATDIPAVLDLAPGANSAWQEVPSIDPDPDKYYTAAIRRVRIGRWRTIP
jgi:hypothetical protein